MPALDTEYRVDQFGIAKEAPAGQTAPIPDSLATDASELELDELAREVDDNHAIESGLLCSLDFVKASALLATEPPPRRYVVDGMLPEPITAGLIAPGGTGKSFKTMQLAACVASGVPHLGHTISNPGGVLMLAAEDDRDELARRLSAIRDMMHLNLNMDSEQEAALHHNLHVVSRVGMENRITVRDGTRIYWDEQRISRIVKTAQAIDNLRLVVLDPVARFRSGDENSNEDATKFVEALEIIRKETGVTVLCVHHSRKGSTGDSQDDIRGGSAFVDALRFAATLYSPKPDVAEKLGIDPDEAHQWVRYKKVMSNYPVDSEELWMRRGKGGALFLQATPTPAPGKAEAKGEERYQAALPKIKEMVRKADAKGEPMTARQFRAHGGQEGVFAMGIQSLNACVSRAIEEGEIHRDDAGKLRLY